MTTTTLRRRHLLAAGLLAPALLVTGPAAAADYTIRFGNLYPEAHSIGVGAEAFARLVAEKTDGRVEVEVFHDSVLGTEREMTEAVQTGALEMVTSGLAGVGLYVPGVHVFELPYLYESMDQLAAVVEELEPEIQEQLTAHGFRALGFNYQGPRSTAVVRPLRSFDDFQGLRLRVPEAPLYVGMAQGMGANPTPVAFPEVYMALQTGVAEAMEGGPDTIFNNKFFEVAPYYVLTEHIFHVLYMVINEDFYQSLPEDIQDALVEAGREATAIQLEAIARLNEESLEAMAAEGTEIIALADKERFQDALEAFNNEYAAGRGPEAEALLERIREVAR
jgi:TRAP-type transport system periplasmic protein